MLTPGSIIEYSFILDLPLTGCEKRVYSLIYSFTIGDFGICFASKSRLAELLRCSQSSVYRALTRLISCGFIEKAKVGKYHGYRALVFEKESKDIREVSENENRSTCSSEEEAKNEEERAAKKGPEKENTAPLYEGQYYKEYMKVFGKYRNLPPPEYSLECYGNHKNVLLTEKQYEALFRLVGYDRLSLYIARLDVLIKNNEKTGKSPPHSAYATIKKWIKNDMEV